MRRALPALLAALALLAPAGALAAECPKTSLGDVEDEVMCSVCGTPLELATEAPQAERERALIRRLVDRCRSKDEIKAVLAAEFGDEVLATPGTDGFDLAAYAVPVLAILLAVGAVGAAALRWRRARKHPAEASAAEPGTEAPGANGEPRTGPAHPRDASASERLEADLERYEL